MTVVSESSLDCFSSGMAWPPGFRFHPTDDELVLYYLKRKMCRRRLKLDVIAETDVYKWDPEELPGQSILKTGDRQWFFFSPRDRKYPNGARSNRATRHGYWKVTGKDRDVTCSSRTVGVKKTLVFYKGRAPHGERTDWVMHEYTLDEEELKRCQGVQDYYALYKVYKKSGPGPKNGEQYGAPFKEEDWADDDFWDTVKSANQQVPRQQPCEATSVDTVTINKQLEPLFDDEIDEILKTHVHDEPIGNQQPVSGFPALPQGVSEEIQSTMVDVSGGVMFPEPIKNFHPGGEQCVGAPSYGVAQSANSHFHVSEAPEVTSATNIQDDKLQLPEEDFLEIDDLLGPESALSNIQTPVENLQFEDGLSEFDLYHDAAMFIHDIGEVDQETFAHPYMGTLDNNIGNQGYELLPNPGDAIQTGGELWMNNQSFLCPAEQTDGSLTLPASGVVYESANFTTEGSLNQNSTVEEVASSRFSSALWAFVESIPTTPASASENALVNRALGRVSSFSRVRMNIKQANVAAGNDNATMKRTGRKGVLFLFFPVLVALCAFLWVSLGTLRLLWRCNS